MGFVKILLRARDEELIVASGDYADLIKKSSYISALLLGSNLSINAAFCSELFIKSCKQEEKERWEDVHPGLGGDLSLDPPE